MAYKIKLEVLHKIIVHLGHNGILDSVKYSIILSLLRNNCYNNKKCRKTHWIWVLRLQSSMIMESQYSIFPVL